MDEISEQVTNDQELLDLGTLSESVPDFLRAPAEQLGVIETELVLDGRLVIGEIRYTGVTRRLVDILNVLDNGYLTMHAGALRDASGRSLGFDLIQIARSSILLAFPHHGSASRVNPGEVIEKHRRLVTVVLPGCEVSGYFHAALGIDPSVATTLVGNRFLALTDVTVTVMDSEMSTRFEPVALLNTAHVQAFVWSDQANSSDSVALNAEAAPANEITEPADSPLT
ncbi:MAG: hypothetical protein E6I03_11525 [Chloroflexi bacterium]|nr:MAG: hypothetical protein E6I03_11525 [Chloroflexota bacterium]